MSIKGNIQRGSIINLDFSPQSGHEQGGFRPAIVLSDGLLDPSNSSFAFVVPVSNSLRDYPFHVKVPPGIAIEHRSCSELQGYAYTDQMKSLDLNARQARVIGQLDINSTFFQTLITYVRSMLA